VRRTILQSNGKRHTSEKSRTSFAPVSFSSIGMVHKFQAVLKRVERGFSA
jgi:hypothetical protein